MKRTFLPLLLSSVLLLSACGDSRLERAGSGAVIGGMSGVAVGAVCCQSPGEGMSTGFFTGVLIGALIGAILDEPLFFNTH